MKVAGCNNSKKRGGFCPMLNSLEVVYELFTPFPKPCFELHFGFTAEIPATIKVKHPSFTPTQLVGVVSLSTHTFYKILDRLLAFTQVWLNSFCDTLHKVPSSKSRVEVIFVEEFQKTLKSIALESSAFFLKLPLPLTKLNPLFL